MKIIPLRNLGAALKVAASGATRVPSSSGLRRMPPFCTFILGVGCSCQQPVGGHRQPERLLSTHKAQWLYMLRDMSNTAVNKTTNTSQMMETRQRNLTLTLNRTDESVSTYGRNGAYSTYSAFRQQEASECLGAAALLHCDCHPRLNLSRSLPAESSLYHKLSLL